jgi:LPXTG-motif cell wall-anchored protein
MNDMILQAGLWIATLAALILFVQRRRKRRAGY